MKRKHHMSMSIPGALMNWNDRDMVGVFSEPDTGRILTPREAKAELVERLARGEKLMPFNEKDCPGFDRFKDAGGCPGHDVPSTCEEICARFPGAVFYTFCVGGLAGPYLPMVHVADRKASVGPWHDDFDDCRIWIERELERVRSTEIAA